MASPASVDQDGQHVTKQAAHYAGLCAVMWPRKSICFDVAVSSSRDEDSLAIAE